jgi:hypothetical protein
VTQTVWRKSSRSNTQGGDCVEVAAIEGTIRVRDGKAPRAGHIAVGQEEFSGLVARIKRGELDL